LGKVGTCRVPQNAGGGQADEGDLTGVAQVQDRRLAGGFGAVHVDQGLHGGRVQQDVRGAVLRAGQAAAVADGGVLRRDAAVAFWSIQNSGLAMSAGSQQTTVSISVLVRDSTWMIPPFGCSTDMLRNWLYRDPALVAARCQTY